MEFLKEVCLILSYFYYMQTTFPIDIRVHFLIFYKPLILLEKISKVYQTTNQTTKLNIHFVKSEYQHFTLNITQTSDEYMLIKKNFTSCHN